MNANTRKRILAAIPSNWCDDMLTGPGAVIGKPPYNCPDIEHLLNGIRARVEAALPKPTRRAKR